MAVESGLNGQGYGSTILNNLEQAARELNITEIMLNARETARGFYEKHGYKVIDSAHTLFNAIPHFKMVKAL